MGETTERSIPRRIPPPGGSDRGREGGRGIDEGGGIDEGRRRHRRRRLGHGRRRRRGRVHLEGLVGRGSGRGRLGRLERQIVGWACRLERKILVRRHRRGHRGRSSRHRDSRGGRGRATRRAASRLRVHPVHPRAGCCARTPPSARCRSGGRERDSAPSARTCWARNSGSAEGATAVSTAAEAARIRASCASTTGQL